jgi:tripartite-type tricarboxylate transporter receptor subunit TctC
MMADFVAGLKASFWTGLGTPKNTRAEIMDRLNTEVNAALADPMMNARFADFGASVFAGSPAEFGRFIAEETERWGKVIRLSLKGCWTRLR